MTFKSQKNNFQKATKPIYVIMGQFCYKRNGPNYVSHINHTKVFTIFKLFD
ncbi:hypothetical protein HanRHA438_Chr04g0190021 [Helianthus annuus]|nr:hypothetical protein HanRHA438_Chr04g0190021 [Helianthus annuus]